MFNPFCSLDLLSGQVVQWSTKPSHLISLSVAAAWWIRCCTSGISQAGNPERQSWSEDSWLSLMWHCELVKITVQKLVPAFRYFLRRELLKATGVILEEYWILKSEFWVSELTPFSCFPAPLSGSWMALGALLSCFFTLSLVYSFSLSFSLSAALSQCLRVWGRCSPQAAPVQAVWGSLPTNLSSWALCYVCPWGVLAP